MFNRLNNVRFVLSSLPSALSVLKMIFDELYLKIYNRLERNLSSIKLIFKFLAKKLLMILMVNKI